MPVAASDPIGPALRPRGGGRLAGMTERLRDFGRRRRVLITVLGSLVTAAILAFLLAGRRDEFTAALSSAEAWGLAVTVLLQIGALLARSEAWHLTIREAGGTVDRRVLYRASSMGVLGGLVNAQLAVAARTCNWASAVQPITLPGFSVSNSTAPVTRRSAKSKRRFTCSMACSG